MKIAGIKAGNDAGFFFPEAVVCAFVWTGQNHMDVTNNSYFADPWLFNCKNDPVQRTIWTAEQRAINYAEVQGVTVVVAEGNQAEDITHPSQDKTSPDDTTPVTRRVTNACAIVPVEVPGVVGVTADGHNLQDGGGYLKSYYSSFGISTADVVAPGGDARYGLNAEATNGRVLSTWPAEIPCARKVVDANGSVYSYLQGTSMASPHVARVAALIVSMFGMSGSGLSPGDVSGAIKSSAVAQPCPSSLPTTNPVNGQPYSSVLGVDDGKVQVCQGARPTTPGTGTARRTPTTPSRTRRRLMERRAVGRRGGGEDGVGETPGERRGDVVAHHPTAVRVRQPVERHGAGELHATHPRRSTVRGGKDPHVQPARRDGAPERRIGVVGDGQPGM